MPETDESMFTLDSAGLSAYAVTHRRATLLWHRATADYIAARCCLLNGLFTGLELGATALEKTMKAMILFRDPGADVRSYLHKLDRLSATVESLAIVDLTSHREVIERFASHYLARYPDNPNQRRYAATDEFRDLDRTLLFLAEHMPAPEEVMLRTGIYAAATASQVGHRLSPEEKWLLAHNDALLPRVATLVARTKSWLAWIDEVREQS